MVRTKVKHPVSQRHPGVENTWLSRTGFFQAHLSLCRSVRRAIVFDGWDFSIRDPWILRDFGLHTASTLTEESALYSRN